MVALEAVTVNGETSALCQSVGLGRATLYRRRRPATVTLTESDRCIQSQQEPEIG
jgi:hypothetical protein